MLSAGTQPTLSSSIEISFHSRIESSFISTLWPSCRTKRLVPLSLGVLLTVMLGDKTIALLRCVNSLFNEAAKRLKTTVRVNKISPEKKPIFFHKATFEIKNRATAKRKRKKVTIADIAQKCKL